MATVTRTETLSETERFTRDKFNRIIDTCTVSAIAPADMSSSTGGIYVQATAPSGKTGDLWFQTSIANSLGVLWEFDGNQWKIVGEGFIGINPNGTTIGAGAAVTLDTTTQYTDSRLGVTKINARTQVPVGVALAEIATGGGTGPIITKGRCIVLKDSTTTAIGDPIIWDGTTSGQMTTGAIGSWGQPHGTGSLGVWLEASSGSSAQAYITPSPRGCWIAAKNNGGSTVVNDASPSALATWQTAVDWAGGSGASKILPGAVGHIIQVRCWYTDTVGATIGDVRDFVFAARAANASVDLDTGAASFSGLLYDGGNGASPTSGQAGRAQLIVWETTGASANQFQWYLDSAKGNIAATWKVHIKEVGLIIGGRIV